MLEAEVPESRIATHIHDAMETRRQGDKGDRDPCPEDVVERFLDIVEGTNVFISLIIASKWPNMLKPALRHS
jgi:hypothetical protein